MASRLEMKDQSYLFADGNTVYIKNPLKNYKNTVNINKCTYKFHNMEKNTKIGYI